MMKNKYEVVKNLLEKTDFVIDYDYTNDRVNVNKRCGGYLFEFEAKHSRYDFNIVESTYNSPTECSTEFTLSNISELAILKRKD